MRIYLLLLLLLSISGLSLAQSTETDSTFLVPVPGPDTRLPTINFLTSEESTAFTERHGIFIVRIVDTPNTYRWSDGTKTISFPPELNTVTICRQGDADGNLVGYLIGAFDKSNGLHNNTKMGLIRKLKE